MSEPSIVTSVRHAFRGLMAWGRAWRAFERAEASRKNPIADLERRAAGAGVVSNPFEASAGSLPARRANNKKKRPAQSKRKARR